MDDLSTKARVGKSLNMFQPENNLRRFCWKTTKHRVFKTFILIVIFTSVFCMTQKTPLSNPDDEYQKSLNFINHVCLVIFILEAAMKIIAKGLYFNFKGSYLRNNWNILDFVVVIFLMIELFYEDLVEPENKSVYIQALPSLKMLRIVSSIRPTRVAFLSLINAVPSILPMWANVIFCMVFFAILQTSIYSGKFGSCYTEHLGLSLR